MIKIKKICLILIFFFASQVASSSEVPYFLDFKYILNESDAGKKAQIYLKDKWDNQEITNTSFPITFEDTKVKGNILTDQRNYNLHYSVY